MLTIALVYLLGLAGGFIAGVYFGERRATESGNVTLELALGRAVAAENLAESLRQESTAAIAAERADSQGRIRQSFDMVSVLVGEARQAITQSRLMMTDAVDITKQATGLLLPVSMGPDDEGPLSITDADRQRAKMQRMGADLEDKRSRA